MPARLVFSEASIGAAECGVDAGIGKNGQNCVYSNAQKPNISGWVTNSRTLSERTG